MEDVFHPVYEAGQLAACQVRIEEGKARLRPQRGEVAFFDRAWIVAGKTVDAAHLVAVVDEALGERRADEAGDARDEAQRHGADYIRERGKDGRCSRWYNLALRIHTEMA